MNKQFTFTIIKRIIKNHIVAFLLDINIYFVENSQSFDILWHSLSKGLRKYIFDI